jgi:hypothetical protein
MLADFKADGRIRNPELLKRLHLEWRECALCGSTGWDSMSASGSWIGLSLHHILKRPRDDVRGNLVMVCGHGTIGCHGLIESNSVEHRGMLGVYVVENRPDVVEYLDWRLGGLERAQEWLQRMLWVRSFPMAPPLESSGQRGAP